MTSLRTLRAALLAAVFVTISAAAAQAVIVDVNGQLNGVDPVSAPGNVPLNTGIAVNAGDTVVLSINPLDTWGFNGQQVNALGTYNFGWAPWNTYEPDLASVPGSSILPGGDSSCSPCIQYGAIAWSLDGLAWGAGYTDTNVDGSVTLLFGTETNYSIWTTGTTFVAPMSGVLRLAMWDSVTNDNSSGFGSDRLIAVDINVTPASNTATPEPASLALLAGALAALGAARRRRA